MVVVESEMMRALCFSFFWLIGILLSLYLVDYDDIYEG